LLKAVFADTFSSLL